MGSDLKEIKEEILKIRSDIKTAIEESEHTILLKIEELLKRIQKVEDENNTLANKFELLERKAKKNNILIFGVQNDANVSPQWVCDQLNRLLGINLNVGDLNNTYQINRTQNGPVKIEFLSFLKKLEVLRNCKKLKGSGISISQDLTFKQRKENKKLRFYLNKAREEDQVTAYIKRNKLIVNNRSYTIEELEENEAFSYEPRQTNSAPPTPTPSAVNNEFNVEEDEQQPSDSTEVQEIPIHNKPKVQPKQYTQLNKNQQYFKQANLLLNTPKYAGAKSQQKNLKGRSLRSNSTSSNRQF